MSESSSPAVPPAAAVKTAPQRKRSTSSNPRKVPPYNVVLLNDDDHTYEYVIEMLKRLFGYNESKGFALADQLNPVGRVILLTTTKEHAELKRDQIHAYGPDRRIRSCQGSMSSIIEPAQE